MGVPVHEGGSAPRTFRASRPTQARPVAYPATGILAPVVVKNRDTRYSFGLTFEDVVAGDACIPGSPGSHVPIVTAAEVDPLVSDKAKIFSSAICDDLDARGDDRGARVRQTGDILHQLIEGGV